MGNIYAVNGGYLEVAEANNMIVLFPQAVSILNNPNGWLVFLLFNLLLYLVIIFLVWF